MTWWRSPGSKGHGSSRRVTRHCRVPVTGELSTERGEHRPLPGVRSFTHRTSDTTRQQYVYVNELISLLTVPRRGPRGVGVDQRRGGGLPVTGPPPFTTVGALTGAVEGGQA